MITLLIMHTAPFLTSWVTTGSLMGKKRREESGTLWMNKDEA